MRCAAFSGWRSGAWPVSEQDLSRFHLDGEFISWPRRPTLMTANTFYLFATMGVILLPLLAGQLHALWPWLNAGVLGGSASVLFQVLVLLAPVLRYRVSHEGVDSALRLNAPKPSALLLAVAAAGVGVFLSHYIGTLWLILIQSLGGRIPGAQSIAMDPMSLASALLISALLPAVCEELMFRGAILGAWERRGTVRALVVSSVLFALLHDSIEGFPIRLMMGFVLGYLVIVADSLYVGVIYHLAHNVGVLLLPLLPESMVVELPRAGERLYGAVGGAAGVTLIALRVLILGVIFAVLLIAASSEREKQGRPFERPGPVDDQPLGWRELIVLISGCVAAGAMLLISLLTAMRIV